MSSDQTSKSNIKSNSKTKCQTTKSKVKYDNHIQSQCTKLTM